MEWKGEADAPPPANEGDWAAIKAHCTAAAELYDSCAAKAGTPRPRSVEHALYMIAVDWLNNMTMYGGLERFESALAKARPDGTDQIMR